MIGSENHKKQFKGYCSFVYWLVLAKSNS